MKTTEAIESILTAWRKYQDDMRPETRNDFLRTFSKFYPQLNLAECVILEIAKQQGKLK